MKNDFFLEQLAKLLLAQAKSEIRTNAVFKLNEDIKTNNKVYPQSNGIDNTDKI